MIKLLPTLLLTPIPTQGASLNTTQTGNQPIYNNTSICTNISPQSYSPQPQPGATRGGSQEDGVGTQTFLSQDPLTQGISYNPLSTLNSNVRGNNQMVGVDHQNTGNSTLNPYILGGQNSLSNRDWDGYWNFFAGDCVTFYNGQAVWQEKPKCDQVDRENKVKDQQFNQSVVDFADNTVNWQQYRAEERAAESNLDNTASDFYNYTVNYGTYLENSAPTPQLKIVDNTKDPYFVYPSYLDYAKSSDKAYADNLASDLSFANLFCKTDNIYPYQCNQYHTALARNYSESYSPYTSAYASYRQSHKKLIVPKPDISLEVLNEGELQKYQLSVEEYNQQVQAKAKALGISAEEYQQKYIKSKTATAFGDLYTKALDERGANPNNLFATAKAVVQLGADVFYIDDAKDCTGKNGTNNSSQAWGCGMSALNILPLFKLGKVANLTKLSNALEGVTDLAKAEEIVKGLNLGKDTEKILQGLRGAGSVEEFLGGGNKVAKTTAKIMTTPEARTLANSLGYVDTNATYKGQKIFYNPKAKNNMKFITQDIGSGNAVGSHNGGVWKAGDSIESLFNKNNRTGTFDANLNQIGK